MTTVKPATIDEYIAAFPPEVQMVLQEVRWVIQQAAPGAAEAISYAIPTFKLKGKNLVHFAAFKNHIGFYATLPAMKLLKKSLALISRERVQFSFLLICPCLLI